ncbi:LysR family transcriptional regulator [Chelativorans salis]|uniref:LysR family transcriptional regulator n=1 Tax=Chelativorans salis TaxID=2978478 RepID=A0ABT2LIH9_9HYPH|nr:LysR family transcriptional regulator [Chelativorans sp. EGI FJ00035]MCT7374124.1 LysR family transcriptional regulator [Chelativorans sp. EGI FJ00035]
MDIENQLTLKQLRAFAAVYRRGRLASAAEELGVTQSAVSVLIRQVEETLNTRLFDRTTRSLVPTRAADEAYGIAERILQDVATLGSNFRDLSEGNRGSVHLAATPATAMTLLPKTAQRFSRRYANIKLVLDDCAPNQFLPNILSERVEFGIGIPLSVGSEFNAEPILEDSMQIVCAHDHPFAAAKEVRWAELRGVPLIVFRPGYGVRQMLDSTLAKVGIEPHIAHEVGFLDTAAWMAAGGLGVTILPNEMARLRAHEGLAIRPLVEPVVTRTVAIVTKRSRSLSPPCRLFLDMLREDIGEAAPPHWRSGA